MNRFDPPAYAAAVRRDRFHPLTQDALPRFGPRGLWQAGTEQLRKVLLGWWSGEEDAMAGPFADARRWLSAAPECGAPWGDPALQFAAEHRHARALAALMAGEDRPALWREAAFAHDRALARAGGVGGANLGPGAAVCAAMAGTVTPAGPPSPIAEIVGRMPDTLRIGRALYERRAELLAQAPELDVTTLFAWVGLRLGGLPDVLTAIRAAWALDPDLPLPPALRAAGWTDADEARVTLADDGRRLDRLLPLLGLAPDRAGPDDPALASWTRRPDLSLEVDRHRAGGLFVLDLRGAGAGRLAAFLQSAGLGAAGPGAEAGLADLLTVPPAAGPASAVTADARWQTLTAALAADTDLTHGAGRALVAAALRDTDWRTRMAALWAIGNQRIPGLAAEAETAPLPPPAFPGLSADDRRILLALRDLAAHRSAGLPDGLKKPTGAGVLARIARLLDAAPADMSDRASGLVATLLRRATTAPIPPAWTDWAALEDGES